MAELGPATPQLVFKPSACNALGFWAGMDLTMWGPWAQDLVGALFKLGKEILVLGLSVGPYVKKNVKKIENI